MNEQIDLDCLGEMFGYSFQEHFGNVKDLMDRAKQTTALKIRMPSTEERLLRARLILEEALETIRSLGISVHQVGENEDRFEFYDDGKDKYDPLGVLDGIADIFVVTTGTGICCGLTNIIEEAIKRVDKNNLSKLDGQHSFRSDGKLLKSPNYKPVVLADLIQRVS